MHKLYYILCIVWHLFKNGIYIVWHKLCIVWHWVVAQISLSIFNCSTSWKSSFL